MVGAQGIEPSRVREMAGQRWRRGRSACGGGNEFGALRVAYETRRATTPWSIGFLMSRPSLRSNDVS
jgi:hypothetical protein